VLFRSLFLSEDHDEMIAAIAAVQPNTIVVAVTPGALETQWRDSISSLIISFMPGQEYGNAIADIIFGDAAPSGKLPVTFPNRENEENFSQSQYPGDDGGLQVAYTEGMIFGYRWYDQQNVTPAFAFGHGLSFVNFSYSNPQVQSEADSVSVTITITNVGTMDAKEVAQLYLSYPEAANEPPKVLRGFKKVLIKAGQSETVTFELDSSNFKIWDISVHDWAKVAGMYTVYVGSSSRDIRFISSVMVN